MKHNILRRAGALVLALALALTLTAPAWAADVNAPSADGISIGGSTIDPTLLAVNVSPSNADPLVGTYTWTIEAVDPDNLGMVAPTFKSGTTDESGKSTLTSRTATAATLEYNSRTNAGEYIVKVVFTPDGGGVPLTATKPVTISGILLKPSRDPDEDGIVRMFLDDSMALSVKPYGSANNSGNVVWTSSDGTVVAVMEGTLTSYGLGTAVITAIKGSYSAECRVKVVEDESVIAGPYTEANEKSISVSNPLNIGEAVYARLDKICYEKTKERSADGKTGYYLDYITNLKVALTSQGVLYYNYVAESDTGDGVSFTDRFTERTKATGTKKNAERLYFVPKPGFVGTAEITFQGVATNGQNFSGTIKVNVGMGTTNPDGSVNASPYQISYLARAGEPAWFMASDFSAFCKSVTGRSFSTVTFSLPRSSEGVLYYNYAGGTGTPVTTTTRFTPSGVYTLDNVCFVPNAAYAGKEVTISFQIVDSSGETKPGDVTVNVIPADVDGEPSNVTVTGEKGRPVTLQGELFNDACQDTIKDALSFVVFQLPDPKEGVLYYNYRSNGSYDSRVTAATRCYYSGVPGLSGITFVPSSGASGRIAIPYTGYGSTGTSFSGTLYISLDEVNSSTIRYSVEKNGSVSFKASDFYNAGLYQKGVGADRVEIKKVSMSKTGLGTLRYDYQSSSKPDSAVSSGTYYVSPNSGQRGLNLLSFHAAGSTGTVTIDYEASCGTGSDRKTFTGQVVIQVGAIAAADVTVSCNTGEHAVLSSYSLGSACGPVMGVSMSYIEITSVPSSREGHLYLNYNGFGTGTAVKPGDRFYRVGSPSIDRLTFVPYAGFTGEAEITYIGYSDNGAKQASGRVTVSVSKSTSSWYFNDMGSHVWAIDSVDYLYWNGTVKGIGDGRYNPAGTIIKGDFTLMLVRAYGLTASGSVSFQDVPDDSYYADAIRIAALLGVGDGTNGYYSPQTALSRQDAMLMIFNALKASGRIVTNGLAADLSGFYDEKDISPYAREAVGCLVQMGVVEGDGNGYLRPLSQLNRAETAKLLHAIMTL